MSMFSGKTIKLGETEYVLPALSLGQLRKGLLEKLREHDKLVNEADTFAAVGIRGEIILAALRRNYPDLDEDVVYDNLDLENSGPLWLQVLGLSGFAQGEDQAATATESGTSSPSTEA